MSCYVELLVTDEERFARLGEVFEAIRRDKQAEVLEPDPKWRAFFDQRALAHFWWPTAEELADHQRRWWATPVDQRFTDPSLQTPWDFDSLFEAFQNGEYELLGIRRVEGRARLEFEPDAFPYGGVGCLCGLVEAFDLPITEIYDGSQPPYPPKAADT